jgi:cell division protein ZapA (FtsZ GTPase activity inhibitor)
VTANILHTYLSDHLAGSVAAIELLDDLLKLDESADRKELYHRLRRDIQEDQGTLKRIIDRVAGSESTLRKAAAWISEKLAQMKTAVEDPGDNRFRILQSLEILALGIQGKLLLWHALAAVAGGVPGLTGIDFNHLQERARQQFDLVEAERLRIAGSALSGL